FSESQIQRKDTRGALVGLEGTEDTPGLLLSWDERWGWSQFGEGGYRPLVLGGEPVLSPETFAHAVTVLLAPRTQQLLLMSNGARRTAHPVDCFVARRLASSRMPRAPRGMCASMGPGHTTTVCPAPTAARSGGLGVQCHFDVATGGPGVGAHLVGALDELFGGGLVHTCDGDVECHRKGQTVLDLAEADLGEIGRAH